MSTREVVLAGGSPWGFRMHGGSDTGQPLRISRVNPGSKAAQKGVREGDVISSINGQPTRSLSNSDAHALLRNAGQSLRLGLNEDCGGSPKRRNYKMATSLSSTPIQNESPRTENTAKGGSTPSGVDGGASKEEDGKQTQKERPSGKRGGRGRKNGATPQPPAAADASEGAEKEAEEAAAAAGAAGGGGEAGGAEGDAPFAGQRSRRAKRGARARRRARARAEGGGGGCATSGCETEGKSGSGGENGKSSPCCPSGGADGGAASGRGCPAEGSPLEVCGDVSDERSKASCEGEEEEGKGGEVEAVEENAGEEEGRTEGGGTKEGGARVETKEIVGIVGESDGRSEESEGVREREEEGTDGGRKEEGGGSEGEGGEGVEGHPECQWEGREEAEEARCRGDDESGEAAESAADVSGVGGGGDEALERGGPSPPKTAAGGTSGEEILPNRNEADESQRGATINGRRRMRRGSVEESSVENATEGENPGDPQIGPAVATDAEVVPDEEDIDAKSVPEERILHFLSVARISELKESVARCEFVCLEWNIAEEFYPVDCERSTEFEIVKPGKKVESHVTSVAVPLRAPAKSEPTAGCEEAPCGSTSAELPPPAPSPPLDRSPSPSAPSSPSQPPPPFACGEPPRDPEPLTPFDYDVAEEELEFSSRSISLPPLPPPPFSPLSLSHSYEEMMFALSSNSDQSDTHPVSDLPLLSSLSSSPTPPSSPPPAAFSLEEAPSNLAAPGSSSPPPLPLPPESIPDLEGSMGGFLPYGNHDGRSFSPTGGDPLPMAFDVSTTPPLPLPALSPSPPPHSRSPSPASRPLDAQETPSDSPSSQPSVLSDATLSLEERRSPLPEMPEEANIRRILLSMNLEEGAEIRTHMSFSRSGGPSPRRRRRGDRRADTFPPAGRGPLEVIEEERTSGNSDDGESRKPERSAVGEAKSRGGKTVEEGETRGCEGRAEDAPRRCSGGCGEERFCGEKKSGSYTMARGSEEGEEKEGEEWSEGWREEEFVEEREGEEEEDEGVVVEVEDEEGEGGEAEDAEGIVVIGFPDEKDDERLAKLERRLSRELFIIPESDEEREEREERRERLEGKERGPGDGEIGASRGDASADDSAKHGESECAALSRGEGERGADGGAAAGGESSAGGGGEGAEGEARGGNEEVRGRGEEFAEALVGAPEERCSPAAKSPEGVVATAEGDPQAPSPSPPPNLPSEERSLPGSNPVVDKGEGTRLEVGCPSPPAVVDSDSPRDRENRDRDPGAEVRSGMSRESALKGCAEGEDGSPHSDCEEVSNAFERSAPDSLVTLCLETVAGLPYGLEILREIWTCTPPVLPERKWRRSPAPSPEGRPRAAARGVEGGGRGEGASPVAHCNSSDPELDSAEDGRGPMHEEGGAGADRRLDASISDRAGETGGANRTLWVPVPTRGSVNICLTPKQLEGFSPTPEQAARLLDMHVKFLERRGYHEEGVGGGGGAPASDTSRAQIRAEGRGKGEEEGGSRLLAMLLGEGAKEGEPPAETRGSPPPLAPSPPLRPSSADSLSAAPSARRAAVGMGTGREEDGAGDEAPASAVSDERRLKTRVLSEWLTLARSGGGDGGEGGLSPSSDSGAGRSSPRRPSQSPTPEDEGEVEEIEILVRPREMPPPANSTATRTTSSVSVRHSSYIEYSEARRDEWGSEEGLGGGDGGAEVHRRTFDAEKYRISKQGDIAIEIPAEPANGGPPTGGGGGVSGGGGGGRRHGKRPVSMPPAITGGEIFRQQMYMEYMNKVAERAERKQQKVIKLTAWGAQDGGSASGSHAEPCAVTEEMFVNEFMGRVKQRMDRMGVKVDDDEEGSGGGEGVEGGGGETGGDSKEESAPSFTIEGGLTELPKYLRDDTELLLADDGSIAIAPTFKATATRPPGVWTPSKSVEDLRTQSSSEKTERKETKSTTFKETDSSSKEDVIPVWVPKSAGPSPTLERKEFRPVNFDASTLKSRKSEEPQSRSLASPAPEESFAWHSKETVESTNTSSSTERRSFIQSPTSPSSGTSVPPFSSRLPRAQNPTITLLQKAREGQLPRGAHYLDEKEKMISKEIENEIMYTVKKEYESEEDKRKRKIVELGPKKFEGIGPTTKEGIPIILRSGIKEENQAKWYRKMYDSLHRSGKDDEFVTVRYKARRGQYPYTSAEGYLSEPDPIGYDSDMGYSAKYATLDRRRIKNKDYNFSTSTMPRSKYIPPPSKYGPEIYKNQPGRIEDYEPGHSSIAEKEAKLHANQNPQPVKPFMTHALKESGYESDSTLLFKRREENIQSLSPIEQKQAYKTIQMGGEVPLHGLRKPAPERPKESPHKYVESEVTIHYRSPIRAQAKEALPEEELARRQEEAMRRIYQEERRRKYLQELQDMESRRHTDNFIPSQKSPIPLNRYDNFLDDVPSKMKVRDHTPEPKVVARALYNFVGQTSRELSFRRGDIIFVRRQIDKNWYEGEHNAMIGLFPFNYVEIIPYDGIRTMPKRPTEGQARAKYNFVAQTHLELSLIKGELVVLTRRVDNNWFEGRIGNRKGIFPISYVEVLVEPGDRPVTPSNKPITSKLSASPVSSSLILNGSNVLSSTTHNQPYSQQYHGKQQKQYQAPTSYTQKTTYASSLGRNPYSSKTRSSTAPKLQLPSVNQTLHIDTHSDPVPYRALYNYKPQNEDELELQEGDTVYVMEKCDDGWYVGSSHRTGYFGTFPGNYVERI